LLSQTSNPKFMNRRNSLSALLGKPKAEQTSAKTLAPPSGTLDPYTGPWTIREASHLLRRSTFGPNQEMISNAISLGLSSTVNELFDNAVPSPPPVIFTLTEEPTEPTIFPVFNDPFVPYGETWVHEPPLIDTGDETLNDAISNGRSRSVTVWPFVNMMRPELNIMSKLWLFWHNHFVVSDFLVPLQYYQYGRLLEDHAKGNFKQLTKEITTDVSMLLYLNGNENTKEAPNENYARELLELFTVGKGDVAGPGDYTTFTEQDVQSMAKVLTGWQINVAALDTKLESMFTPDRHDTGSKQLSARFNNELIQNAGANEYSNLIDVIFESEHAAKFICRQFYIYFLNHEIDAEIESNIIEPMAQILRDDDYNVERALKTLLSSEHFYSEEAIGCMIKNPADFVMSSTKGLNMVFNGDPASDYFFSTVFYVFAAELDMRIFFHNDVAGWKAYYQKPQYYRNWINTFHLPSRNQTSTSLVGGGPVNLNGNIANIPQLINVINVVATIENASDINDLIYGLTANLFAYPISEGQKDYLKEFVIPGLPDFEWTVEYSDYLADPFNPDKRIAINNKLVALFSAILEMPEYQLM